MGDDVERIVVGYQWTQVQACYVLNRILGAYARGQFLVCPYLVAQSLNLLDEIRVALSEGLPALLVARVEYRAVGQDYLGTYHHAIAVGMHATVHARGVVTDDAAHHRTSDTGRVGGKHTAVRLQNLVYPGAHDTGLQFYALAIRRECKTFPVLACYDKHRVGAALSRKRGASSTEGERHFMFFAGLDYFGYLFLTVTANDGLWNLAIETGIGTPSKGAKLVCIDPVRRDHLSDFSKKTFHHSSLWVFSVYYLMAKIIKKYYQYIVFLIFSLKKQQSMPKSSYIWSANPIK